MKSGVSIVAKHTLNEVEDAEVALLRIYGKHEVERRVVPVDELRAFPPLGNDPFQVVAERVWPLCHLLKDALYHAFLGFFADLVCLINWVVFDGDSFVDKEGRHA